MLAAWVSFSFLVIICILLSSSFSAINATNAQQENQATQTSVPTSVTQAANGHEITEFGYGIQVRADLGDVGLTISNVEQLELGWVKQQVRWDSLQPTPDAIHWDWLDTFVAEANAANLKVMFSIVSAPDWTRASTSSGRTGPPDNFQDYVTFVTAILERYPGQVHAIEVWNEQNLQREWFTIGGLNAARYVEMLGLTYEAVKTIDPQVIVVSGALSPTGVNDGIVAVDDFVYLQQMLDAGLLEVADCIGAHHTGVNLPPDLTAEEAFQSGPPQGTIFLGPYDADNPLNPHHSWSFRSTLRGQHQMVVDAGGTQKLCVTEFGWPTLEGLGVEEAPPEFEFAYDNSLEDQAAYVVQGYQLLREWDIARMAFLWNLDFAPKGNGTLDDNVPYSILGTDGEPRPAFYAIAAMPKN